MESEGLEKSRQIDNLQKHEWGWVKSREKPDRI